MVDKLPVAYKCKKCAKLHFPKHGRCLNCKNREFETVNLPAEGTLVTYTILSAPPAGIDKLRLCLGIIQIGDVKYTGQLDIEPELLKMGMKVRPVWKRIREIKGESVEGFAWVEA
ncbi:MAG: Zn-ribbon domain-containing OB-fold protein [Candidatus Hodarchaeales archaeon]